MSTQLVSELRAELKKAIQCAASCRVLKLKRGYWQTQGVMMGLEFAIKAAQRISLGGGGAEREV